jgi:hypothetical protein
MGALTGIIPRIGIWHVVVRRAQTARFVCLASRGIALGRGRLNVFAILAFALRPFATLA